MINIDIGLYGKPSWDMDIEGKDYIEPKMIRKQGEFLKEHLHKVADMLEKLQSAGWIVAEGYGAIYSLQLYKETTKVEAKKELKRLKINPKDIHIEEYAEEEFEDEE